MAEVEAGQDGIPQVLPLRLRREFEPGELLIELHPHCRIEAIPTDRAGTGQEQVLALDLAESGTSEHMPSGCTGRALLDSNTGMIAGGLPGGHDRLRSELVNPRQGRVVISSDSHEPVPSVHHRLDVVPHGRLGLDIPHRLGDNPSREVRELVRDYAVAGQSIVEYPGRCLTIAASSRLR